MWGDNLGSDHLENGVQHTGEGGTCGEERGLTAGGSETSGNRG